MAGESTAWGRCSKIARTHKAVTATPDSGLNEPSSFCPRINRKSMPRLAVLSICVFSEGFAFAGSLPTNGDSTKLVNSPIINCRRINLAPLGSA